MATPLNGNFLGMAKVTQKSIKPGAWQLKDGRVVFVEAVGRTTVRFLWKLSRTMGELPLAAFADAADFMINHGKHEISPAGLWQPKGR